MTRTKHPTGTNIRRITRRDFVVRTAALSGIVSAPWIIPSSVRGAGGNATPSERITVGLIGKGLMGSGHLHRLLAERAVQVLAVCDVDRQFEPGEPAVTSTIRFSRTTSFRVGSRL